MSWNDYFGRMCSLFESVGGSLVGELGSTLGVQLLFVCRACRCMCVHHMAWQWIWNKTRPPLYNEQHTRHANARISLLIYVYRFAVGSCICTDIPIYYKALAVFARPQSQQVCDARVMCGAWGYYECTEMTLDLEQCAFDVNPPCSIGNQGNIGNYE